MYIYICMCSFLLRQPFVKPREVHELFWLNDATRLAIVTQFLTYHLGLYMADIFIYSDALFDFLSGMNHEILFDILSDIRSMWHIYIYILSFYRTFFLAFCLTFTFTFYLAIFVVNTMTFYLTLFLAFCLSYIRIFYLTLDILSGILSEIFFDMLSDCLFGI